MKKLKYLPDLTHFSLSLKTLVILATFTNLSYAIEPTTAQIAQFRSLPQAQKNQLINKYQKKGTAKTQADVLSNPITVKPRTGTKKVANVVLEKKIGTTTLKLFGYDLLSKSFSKNYAL